MLLFRKIDQLKAYLSLQRSKGLSVGYVPTMGALHKGHASLIEKAKAENDISVCSIFVNPTQFNDTADLDKYPRTDAADIDLLAQLRNDVLFFPSVEEIYPTDLETPTFDFGKTDKVMEGFYRPGHFDGVVQVVHRLVDIVEPTRLYMGQKDFQQFTLIQHMLKQMESPTELIVCPIIREGDGLALSSRNVRLTPENRTNAPIISQTLQSLNEWLEKSSVKKVKEKALAKLSAIPGFKPEYFDIVDGYTLQPIKKMKDSDYVVACIAVWTGDIRLIDNEILKKVA